jgi:molybdate/tungstate transport system substrate-binding protein
LELPDELNLGSDNIDYSGVEVDLNNQRFATVEPVFKGEQIAYGITIPSNADHPDAAALFIAFLLSPDGRAIMQANAQPVFAQPIGNHYSSIPTSLQGLCSP